MKSIKGACTRIIHIIYNRITSNPKYKPAHNTAELFRRRSKCSFEVIDVTSRISSDLETLKIWSYTTFQFSSKGYRTVTTNFTLPAIEIKFKEGLMVVTIVRLCLPPLDEDLCIKREGNCSNLLKARLNI